MAADELCRQTEGGSRVRERGSRGAERGAGLSSMGLGLVVDGNAAGREDGRGALLARWCSDGGGGGRVLDAGSWGRGRAQEAWGSCCGQLKERVEELEIKAPARSEAGHDDGSRGGGGWLQGQRWSSRERGDGIKRVLLALAVCGGGGQRERGREEGIGIERRECGLGLRD